ncbi:Undecaprenyl-phosphate 4-deoxy-4-formamido-L-arabinose transferase [compost metagenome]
MSLVDQPCVSIIVPVYNVEKYLDRCLGSLLNQSYSNIQIVLVDDGSSDGSLEKCRVFAKTHNKCLVLTQANAGQGTARNFGMQHALGEFICFVDGDDWIDVELISDMVQRMGADVDFISYGLDFVTEAGAVSHKIDSFRVDELTGASIFEHAMLDDQVLSSPVNKLYRAELLEKYAISFPSVRACEDMFFSRAVAFYARRAVFISRVYYHALIRDGSTSRNVTINFLREAVKTLDLERLFLQRNGVWVKYSELYCAHYAKQAAHLLVLAAFRMNSYKEYLSAVVYIMQQEMITALRSNKADRMLNAKHRIVLLLGYRPLLLKAAALGLRLLGVRPY